MKYLVMECFDSYAVLLDEDGRFVKSANLGYEVGQTVENPVLMRGKSLEKRKMPTRFLAGIATVAAVIGLFFGYSFYQENYTPYSSIVMSINPEVEMVLNKRGEVIDLAGKNEDGIHLLEGYEVVNQDKIAVANELVDRAVEMDYLAEGGRISFAIDTPDQVLFEEYGIELRKELDGRISITIEITDMEHRPPQEKDTEAEPDEEADVNSDSDESKTEKEEEVPEDESELISLDEAKQIAFDHAGVDGSGVKFDDDDLEWEDGEPTYELNFEIGEDEYEYIIHARTGKILKYEVDVDD